MENSLNILRDRIIELIESAHSEHSERGALNNISGTLGDGWGEHDLVDVAQALVDFTRDYQLKELADDDLSRFDGQLDDSFDIEFAAETWMGDFQAVYSDRIWQEFCDGKYENYL